MSQAELIESALLQGVLTRRVLAWAVDALLIAGVIAVAWHVCLIFGILTLGLGLPLFSVLPAIPLLYTWIFAASPMAATPGLALFGLVLVRNNDLGPPGGLAALGWAAGFYVTVACGAIWLAVALLTVRRRTLHDIVSGLTVVRTKALTDAFRFGNMRYGGYPPA